MEARFVWRSEKLALAARDFFPAASKASRVKLTHVVYDKYGDECRADVEDETGDIAHALLEAGRCAYHGERREPWCGGRERRFNAGGLAL